MVRLGLLFLLLVAVGWWTSRPAPPVAAPPGHARVTRTAPPIAVPSVPPVPAPSKPQKPTATPDPGMSADSLSRMAALYQATSLGWQAIQSEHYEQALGYFQQAADGGPADALFGLAVAYYRLQRPAEAQLMASQAAAALPERAGVWRLVGQLAYEDNDLAGAVDAWERAQDIEFDAKLVPLLTHARADLGTNQRFFVGETSHFRTRFEGPEVGYLAERVLDILEAAYSSVGLALGYYPDKVIETVLYTRKAFHDVTRSPSWAGGIYDGKVRLPISGADQDPDTLRRVVTHEYVHAALAERLGRRPLPAWLHEGIAMNLEGSDPRVLVRWSHKILPQGTAGVPLSRLSGSLLGLSATDADRAYAESYVLVASLIERFGMFRLADLLSEAAEGPFDDAFLTTYGETPDAALGHALAAQRGG